MVVPVLVTVVVPVVEVVLVDDELELEVDDVVVLDVVVLDDELELEELELEVLDELVLDDELDELELLDVAAAASASGALAASAVIFISSIEKFYTIDRLTLQKFHFQNWLKSISIERRRAAP